MFKNGWKKKFTDYLKNKKRLIIGFLILIVAVALLNFPFKNNNKTTSGAKTVTIAVDKSFEFPSFSNDGKPAEHKIKLKIDNSEKTNQVLVKDQVFTAKNNKLFLIINLELRNDSTLPLNILPGDLIRLSIGSDKDTRFAPDLHNNLVPVAPISTRVDRLGFVIPEKTKNFTLYIGEIEGEKQEISLNFPS